MQKEIVARIMTKDGIKMLTSKEYLESMLELNKPIEDIVGGLAIIYNISK